ncbi:MAG TPA: hydrogenase maturation nickel metallochaperone HypA [Verrucomicrobiota bacterium]|nr:hydrogenase maturation nickel metallochaperone HypA [Verrucomicrobiota bacterium]HNU50780.1 hydrogenase maturation nickel metallochaperone HypA [Verrucomicrobiota bacterium]
MHEVGIIQNAVAMALQTARESGAIRVHRVRLRVGTMSGVVPDALRFAFDLVCQGTAAEGAELEIEEVPAACWCAACAAEFVCEDYINECPRCHAVSGELRRGRELELATVEVS